MKVEVLGPGCKRCDQLYENAQNAVAELDTAGQIEVIKIGDINYFAKMGVFMTPGLIIDGEVGIVGSTNWTYSALEKNHEVSVLIRSPEVARNLYHYFQRVWKTCVQ